MITYTVYPLLSAANYEVENGCLLKQAAFQLPVGGASVPNQEIYGKKLWVQKQRSVENGEYTIYSWARDAKAIDQKFVDNGGRRINLIEGVVVKGWHEDIPITEALQEQLHNHLMPYFEKFFSMDRLEWTRHGLFQNAASFTITPEMVNAPDRIMLDDIGKIHTSDFTKKEEEKTEEAPVTSLHNHYQAKLAYTNPSPKRTTSFLQSMTEIPQQFLSGLLHKDGWTSEEEEAYKIALVRVKAVFEEMRHLINKAETLKQPRDKIAIIALSQKVATLTQKDDAA